MAVCSCPPDGLTFCSQRCLLRHQKEAGYDVAGIASAILLCCGIALTVVVFALM